MKILISMLHVVNHGGAAMVMLEFAELFRSEGHQVDMCTWWSGLPMHDYFVNCGVRRLENLHRVNPFDYDIVFFLHQNAPMHFPAITQGTKKKTLILFLRLSHSSNIGVPAAVLDELIMDKTFVNSEEVRLRMVNDFGLAPEKLEIFNNASPSTYEKLPPPQCPNLNRVLYVSNHCNAEIVTALKILRTQYGLKTLHIGEGGDKQIRVNPEIIASSDVVITMAKTAQYALLSRKPLFIYDYIWGGPGYLSAANFLQVSEYNFSGSYKPNILSAEQIAKDIIEQYRSAWSFAASLNEKTLSPYRLEKTLQRIYQLYEGAELNSEKIKRLQKSKFAIKRERCYVEQFYTQYRKSRSAGNQLSALRRAVE